MPTLFRKSLLTSLFQREDLYPSLAKRGKGRFFIDVNSIVSPLITASNHTEKRVIVISIAYE